MKKLNEISKSEVDDGREAASFRLAGNSDKKVQQDDDLKAKKKKVIKDIIKKKTKNGKDTFDPEPEIREVDTLVKA